MAEPVSPLGDAKRMKKTQPERHPPGHKWGEAEEYHLVHIVRVVYEWILSYKMLDFWEQVTLEMHKAGHPRTMKAIMIRWGKLNKEWNLNLDFGDWKVRKAIIANNLHVNSNIPFWEEIEDGRLLGKTLEEALGSEMHAFAKAAVFQEATKAPGETVPSQEKDGDDDDTPAAIVKRADKRWQLVYDEQEPKLSAGVYRESVRFQVRQQLAGAGILVNKNPWRDLIEQCGKAKEGE